MNKYSDMTEREFRNHLLTWANDGHFNNLSARPEILASFQWCMNAGDEYIAYCPVRGEYDWCGITFNITANSKTDDVLLIKD
jgi:hypothetical protein|tara:strand:+ start:257 stop:502 length:246 start_codon:yes stop_codon:yes gene_type:complete